MGSIGKLLAAGSPLIAAFLTQIGLVITETEVNTYMNLIMWGIAVLSMLVPSVRAWLNHKENAQ